MNTQFSPPAEWSPHRALWTAWPSHADLWEEGLAEAQKEFVALCRAVGAANELLEILVPDAEQLEKARVALQGVPVRFHEIPFGDIWLRDTGPIFVKNSSGRTAAVRFEFNGWGEKYVLPHDDQVSRRVSLAAGVQSWNFSWVLEGGALDNDGEGTCLTTRQCLLASNRHPGGLVPSERSVEERLAESLGVRKVLWLDEGLANDHTDGHIDNLARFIAPGVVACMAPASSDDPNRAVLLKIIRALESFTDAKGRRLRVVQIPSPGRIVNEEGEVVPASHMNFIICNRAVAVPTYGTLGDHFLGDQAVKILAEHFPGRKVVGLAARGILAGGGAFHCITQQEPL